MLGQNLSLLILSISLLVLISWSLSRFSILAHLGTLLSTFNWLVWWNEMFFPIANQMSLTHRFKRFSQQWPVVRVVISQKRFM